MCYFQFEIIINVLFSAFRFRLNTILWVYGHYKYVNFFSRGDRLYTSESDVCKRQNLTYKDGFRGEKVTLCHHCLDLSNKKVFLKISLI